MEQTVVVESVLCNDPQWQRRRKQDCISAVWPHHWSPSVLAWLYCLCIILHFYLQLAVHKECTLQWTTGVWPLELLQMPFLLPHLPAASDEISSSSVIVRAQVVIFSSTW